MEIHARDGKTFFEKGMELVAEAQLINDDPVARALCLEAANRYFGVDVSTATQSLLPFGPPKVLLMASTDVEITAVRECAERVTGVHSTSHPVGNKTYYNLGTIGGATVALVRCEMGSSTLSGSILTTIDAIRTANPGCMILLGIAFGVEPKKQIVGQVLVSKQVCCYEMQRVGTGDDGDRYTLTRGDKATASARPLDRLRDGALSWAKADVNFGTLLSGEKLVDNYDFREELRGLDEEAIGGDMELSGMYAAAHFDSVEWIAAKAICDWADGKKRIKKAERQKVAADNSADFIMSTLALGGFQ